MMEVEGRSSLSAPDGRVLPFINHTDLPDVQIAAEAPMREVAALMSRWIDNARNAAGRSTMFDRGIYTPPDNPYDEMRAARHACRYDSIVSGVAEVTEAYAFQGVKWESSNADDADVFNQLSIVMNLDDVIRKMWHEEYVVGQFVAAKLWGQHEFTVRGKSKGGNARKKTYKVWAPSQIRILDAAKVVPIGMGPLGGEGLAWQATPGEIGYYTSSYQGETIDPLMASFFDGAYQPGFEEAGELGMLGVNVARLLVMNPQWVFRHTLTKPDYERFPDIRMKSIFGLLDLKQQLLQADRAALIGAANYILLIRKGLPSEPAQSEEIEALKTGYNFIAKMPVIISDHRLSIDIISPKVDLVLNPEKYDTLDQRILARLLGTLSVGTPNAGRSETQITLAPSVAKVMENRRHMLKRTLELEVARAIVKHPRNRGLFNSEPNLVYTPRNVGLATDPGYVQALLALRTQREISRETILEYFGLDESVEAMRMEMEAEMYDDIFKTEIPYAAGAPSDAVDPALDKGASPPVITPPVTKDGPNRNAGTGSMPASGQPSTGLQKKGPNGTAESPKVSGARGGRPVGGGKSTASPASIAKPRTRTGAPSTK